MPPKTQPKTKTPAQIAKRRARNARRSEKRRQNRMNKSSMISNPSVYPLPGSADTGLRHLSKIRLNQGQRLTEKGLSFLKCAFAPPDFAANDVAGVPDLYQGPSLVKKHRLTSTISNQPNKDLYIVVAPVPGTSFFYLDQAAATAVTQDLVFKGVDYPDTTTLFPHPAASTNYVNKFRYISNHVEIIPTVNQMSWAGSIQVWKTNLALSERLVQDPSKAPRAVTGMQAVNAVNSNQFTAPVNLGCYSGAYNSGDFLFSQIIEGYKTMPDALITNEDFCQFSPVTAFTGMDNNFESIIIKISGTGATSNSFIIKTWACVEYQCAPGNLLYEFSTLSPEDKLAVEIYRKVINNLPVAVSFIENDSFWKRVLSIIKSITAGAAFIPGPVGLVSGGVSSVISGLEQLAM